MVYAVFSVEKSNIEKANEVLKDDTVSRQSIAVRDATALEIKKDVRYILIEGSESALKKAEELFKNIGKKEDKKTAKQIYEKIKKEEENVAEGVGFVFGE